MADGRPVLIAAETTGLHLPWCEETGTDSGEAASRRHVSSGVATPGRLAAAPLNRGGQSATIT